MFAVHDIVMSLLMTSGSRVLRPNNLHTSTPPSGTYDNDKPIGGMHLEENFGLPCGAFDLTWPQVGAWQMNELGGKETAA